MPLVDISLIDFLEDSSALRYHYPLGGNVTTGSKNLIQSLIKRILTIRGSNELEPTVGSNFYGLFGTINYQDIDEVKETFPMLLDALATEYKAEQAQEESEGVELSDDERLQGLTLESVEYDETFGGWLIRIKIETDANQFFVINI